jgi:glycosyltransferase involved in cell wall biosynthesis
VDALAHFEGWADQSAAACQLANADALILPSYDEGLPLVILEALANGVAVVCTPVGEIPGVLTEGVNAKFVQAGDAASIAVGLHAVLENPPLRETLERNGRVIFEQQFSLSHFFESIARIHRKYIGIGARLRAPAPPSVASVVSKAL